MHRLVHRLTSSPVRAVLPALGLALALLALSALPAEAWGPRGHRAIGAIAEDHLGREARLVLRDLMGPETLARAGTWSDDIRSDPAWDHAGPWHYINLDPGETLETSSRNPDGDIIEALERFSAVLADRSAPREERVQAVRWLTHLVADLHMPLHAGKAEDRGGNDVRVQWFGEPANLHWVWDAGILDSTGLSYTEIARFVDHPTAEELQAWKAGTFEDWMVESQALLPEVYEIGDGQLGYEYRYRHQPTVERRVLQAGVRLAALLERILAPPQAGPLGLPGRD